MRDEVINEENKGDSSWGKKGENKLRKINQKIEKLREKINSQRGEKLEKKLNSILSIERGRKYRRRS